MKKNSSQFIIRCGYYNTPFGKCFLAVADEGICHLSFCNEEKNNLEILKKAWPEAEIIEDDLKQFVESIFLKDQPTPPLFLKGTDFQLKVWAALQKIPFGTTTYYEKVAYMIGHPKAVRAAASAIANNPIAYLIPCHRVITKSGKIHNYRWGAKLKQTLLEWEGRLEKGGLFQS